MLLPREVLTGTMALIVVLGTLAVTAGCASQPPRPTVEMTRARTLIDQADQNGAQRYAAADLQTARDKLSHAGELSDKGETQQAQWLAEEAGLDAQLASARAASGKEQRAATQVNESIESLRSETQRNEAPPAGTPPAAQPDSIPPQSTQPDAAAPQ